MSTHLEQQLNSLTVSEDCDYHGTIGNYLNGITDIDPVLEEALRGIASNVPNSKICTGIKCAVNREAISNQIIRYKDIFKLEGKALTLPYLIYGEKNNQQKGLLVVPQDEYGYLYAKGYYYCITEPGGLFIDCKNDLVAICSDDAQKIIVTFEELFNRKAGALQRELDREHFQSYDDLKTQAIQAGAMLKEHAQSVLSHEREKIQDIYHYIIHWFLLKKVLYVQYMVNKDLLEHVHDGNVKKQRNQAKMNADEVSFLSLSEMWSIPLVEE